MSTELNWQTVCAANDLKQQIGARALINKKQIAMFRVNENLYAIDAIDPFSKAAVLSRGIVGSLKDKIVVASPILKQHFDLSTGTCVEDEAVNVNTYAIREHENAIQIALG